MNKIAQKNYQNIKGLSLDARMKKLEQVTNFHSIPKLPLIVKIVARNLSKRNLPSDIISTAFVSATLKVCMEIQHIEFAFNQENEVYFLFQDYKVKKQTQFLNGDIQKIISVVTSKFTYYFNFHVSEIVALESPDELVAPIEFETRAFPLPFHEINNYFISKQTNGNTNGRAFKKIELELPVKELGGDKINLLINKNMTVPEYIVRKKWVFDTKTPSFKEDKKYIEQIVTTL